jgi:hypothetical protein
MTKNNPDISRRDALKVLATGTAGLIAANGFKDLNKESYNPDIPFEAYISTNKDRVNILFIKDKTTEKAYASKGMVLSGQTPDGLPATIFTQTAALEASSSTSRDGDKMTPPETKIDIHGLNKNVLSKLQNTGTLWADVMTNASPSDPDFLTKVFAKQEELVKLYEKLGVKPSTDQSGLKAFPVNIDIIEVRDLITNKPDHAIVSMHAPDANNTFIHAWKLTALSPIEDSKIGYGKGIADTTVIDRPIDVIFSAPTPQLEEPRNEQNPTVELDINPVFTETARGEYLGVPIVTNLITDATLDPIIHKVERDDSYKNFDAAMSEYMAYTIYYTALKTGGKDGTGIKNTDGSVPTIEQYMAMVDEARNGTRPYEDIQIVLKLNKMETEGYDAVKIICWPFYTEGSTEKVPDDVRTITEFNIILFRSGDNKIVNHDPSAKSLGVNILSDSLYIYRGILTSSPNAKTDRYLVEDLQIMPYFIATNTLPKSFDKNVMKILSNSNPSQDGFRSIFKIS